MVDERKIPEGYRVIEVGVIPEDWDIKKVGDIAFVSSGGTPNTKIIEYWNGKIRWMNSGELNLKRVYEVDGRITELGLNNSSTKIIPKNSILIGLAGQGKTRGTAAINYVDLCINQSIAAIYPSNFYDSEFLYQNINSRYDELRSMSTGDGGRGGLNLKIIRELQIHLPTLSEQKAIAEALSDTDNLISSLEKLIDKKNKIKQGAMQQLLTGKKRLPGFNGEWEEFQLVELLDYEQPTDYIVESTDYSVNGIPVLTPGKSFVLGYTNETSGIFSEVPVIIFDDFTTVSKFVTFPFKVKSSAMKMLKLRDKAHNLRLIFKIMQILKFTIGDHKRYWISEYSRLKINLPSIEEQNAIDQVLSDMDLEIEGLEEKLEKVKTIKQGMMQELLTGRIRLI